MNGRRPQGMAEGAVAHRRHRKGIRAALAVSVIVGGPLGIALLAAAGGTPGFDQPRPKWWEKATIVDGIPRVKEAPVALGVMLVAGADGGLLRAGGDGWVVINLRNTAYEVVRVCTATTAGKPWPFREVSYTRVGLCCGLGVAALRAEFVDERGRTVSVQSLSPPDSVLRLQADGRKALWRRIRSPNEAGTYRLRITLDTSAVRLAAGTRNNSSPNEIEPAFTAVCVAEGVRVGDKRSKLRQHP